VYKTYYPKAEEINRQWLLVDANGETLGRLATKIASLLLGKNKPTFTPGVELGDFVVVINAQIVSFDQPCGACYLTIRLVDI
jgi:large subunit ribosomal protein L13